MFKAPFQLPPLSLLLDDMPTRCTRSIARHLGISERTLKRYQDKDQAPRALMLALFWESRWGLSILDCEAVNRDRVRQGLIGALQLEGQQLRATVARLLELGDFGAANAPLWGANFEGAGNGPAAMRRAASAVAVTAGIGTACVGVDPGTQGGQVGQHHGGDDGPTYDDDGFTDDFRCGGDDFHRRA